jgi:O-antigen/teichoic acid export membrane protein
MPGISYLAHADPQRARRLLYRVILTLVGASGLLAAAALPFAEPIMRAIFGGDFASGADLLRIVLIGIPGYATLGVCWFAVVAFDGEARLVGIGLVGLAISAVLSAILIPSAGDEGAAWTYVGSLYAMAALTVLVLERQLGRSAERPAQAEAEAAASALG